MDKADSDDQTGIEEEREEDNADCADILRRLTTAIDKLSPELTPEDIIALFGPRTRAAIDAILVQPLDQRSRTNDL
ncbi:hypothetical protein Daus18300_005452 [Diaporthe australafricana]|uniref:Uncharacterized protein n=1 Tax=Diaporthe australafricana TaxID=127596 RepID=A0ABR3X0X4_9PEZI